MRPNTNARNRGSRQSVGCAVERLEDRRLLAVFNGTEGADTITLVAHPNASAFDVIINGRSFRTIDGEAIVNCLGGNDTVRLSSLDHGGISHFTKVVINLGDGNDVVEKSFKNTNVRDEGVANIFGDAGRDAMRIVNNSEPDHEGHSFWFVKDGSFGATHNLTRSRFNRMGVAESTSYRYDDSLEEIELLLADNLSVNSITRLENKPPSVHVTVTGQGANDEFFVGGGDIDDSGFTVSTTSVTGGAGRDAITFDDQMDAEGFPEDETYNFDHFTLRKGFAAGVTYSAIETQTLLAADSAAQLLTPSTINLNALSGQIESTTITGGSLRANAVNFTQGDLNSLSGVFHVKLGAAGGTINVNDQNGTGEDSYVVTANQLRRMVGASTQRTINYSAVDALVLNANAGPNNIVVEGTLAGTALTANAGGGDDTMTIGDGSLANVDAPITFTGGAGTDRIRINNVLAPGFTSATITSGSFTADGGLLHRWAADVERVDVALGHFGSDVRVESSAAQTTITGGNGDDSLTVGKGNYSSNILGQVTFNGGNGDDLITYDDAASAANDTYAFSGGNQFLKAAPAAATVTSSVEHKTLEAGSGNNTIDVALGSQGLRIHANAGNDTVRVGDSSAAVTVNTGPEDATTSPFGDALVVNSDAGTGDATVTAIIDQDDSIRALNVLPGGTLRVASDAVLHKVSGGQFNLQGTIDLAGGAMLGGPTQAALRNFLIRGRAGGAWNGTSTLGAINSSLAAGSKSGDGIGYGLGAQIAVAAVGSFSIGPTELLTRYTLEGDANLDQAVNFSDLVVLAQNYGTAGRSWVQGDSNFDSNVGFQDLVALAQTYGAALSPPPAAALGVSASVPAAAHARSAPAGPSNAGIFNSTAPIARPKPPSRRPGAASSD